MLPTEYFFYHSPVLVAKSSMVFNFTGKHYVALLVRVSTISFKNTDISEGKIHRKALLDTFCPRVTAMTYTLLTGMPVKPDEARC